MTTNKDYKNDIANHVGIDYVVLFLHEEINSVNLQTSSFKKKQWSKIEAKLFEKIENNIM